MNQIIFFDGVCSLCNGFVDFLVRKDVELHFKFAPLQGETAKKMLPPEYAKDLETLVLWSQGQPYTRADAVLMIASQLGGIWNLAKLGWIIPGPIRNFLYKIVAANRYRIFGKRDSCRLPTAEERARFLN